MTVYTPIDLSRLPAPDAILPQDHAALLAEFQERFLEFWNELRATRPELPEFTVERLVTDPANVVGRTWSFIRLLDRQRVNDAVRAVLAPLAKGANLDNVVARQGVVRLEVSPGVMENDERLLYRYLLSFGRASAGSADRLLYDAFTAWPAMHDARVNGWAVHGRRGEIDLVISGPDGMTTPEQVATIRAAVTTASAKPEAIGIFVLAAQRVEYQIEQAITVPVGPHTELVRQEAVARVQAAANDRMLIGARVQRDLIAGGAFGPSVAGATHIAPPADIACTAYQIPVCTAIDISASN